MIDEVVERDVQDLRDRILLIEMSIKKLQRKAVLKPRVPIVAPKRGLLDDRRSPHAIDRTAGAQACSQLPAADDLDRIEARDESGQAFTSPTR